MPQSRYVGRHRPHAKPSRGRRHVVPVALLTATVAGSFAVRAAGASELTPDAAANTTLASAVAEAGLSPNSEAVAAATANRTGQGASRSDSRRAVAAPAGTSASNAPNATVSARTLALQAEKATRAAAAARLEAAARSKAAAKKATAVRALEQKKADAKASAHRWVAPVLGYTLTSGFGYRWGKMHPAQDLARPVGGLVRSLSAGTVIYAGWDDTGYGNLVRIQYWDGTVSWMAHNSQVLITVGKSVAPGQVVAHSGNTGQSTGPHVHLEIHPGGGAAVPPLPWLAQHGVRL